MTRSSAPRHASQKRLSLLPWPILVLLLFCILPEVIFQLVGPSPAGTIDFRSMAYLLGAFQPGLLSDHGPLFPGQSLSMFVTYGFLHTGPSHLIINMIGLVWLGRLMLTQRSSETFFTFYLLATIGAAEVFALINSASGTMVGASGALFGLLGVYLVDTGLLSDSNASPHLLPRVVQVFLVTLGLILADLGSSKLLGSPVAWQAHAGGFLTGALCAMIFPPRHRKYP